MHIAVLVLISDYLLIISDATNLTTHFEEREAELKRPTYDEFTWALASAAGAASSAGCFRPAHQKGEKSALKMQMSGGERPPSIWLAFIARGKERSKEREKREVKREEGWSERGATCQFHPLSTEEAFSVLNSSILCQDREKFHAGMLGLS